MADPVSLVLRQPFAEQVAAFRLRLGDLVPTRAWDDLRHNAHDRAFMVAGAMKADLLADLAGAVDKAISQGTTLEEFRRDFRAIVERNGWHGWTGEGSAKGEAWRTKVIYQTNLRTSYMAGRRAQLIDGKFKYWVYRHSGARHPRLDHLSWDGVALPPVHEFWATHYPPNGWGCGCRVFGARTAAGIRRQGGDPDKKLPDGWQVPEAKTGTPPGIGKGWDYAPGATVSETVRDLAQKLDRLPQEPAIDLIQSWVRSETFARWAEAPEGDFPLARLPEADAGEIGAVVQVAMLSAETMAKQLREHPELSVEEYAAAQAVILGATHKVQDGPQNLIYIQAPEADNGHVLVVKATTTGRGLFVTSFRRLGIDPGNRERVINRLLRKGE